MKNTALAVAGTLFLIIALIHLVRIFNPFVLIIDGVAVPLWINGVAFVITGLLSAFMFYALGSTKS